MSRVLLGVTGGIAAYKACELCRLLVKDGHDVVPLVTSGAERFVTDETFRALARRPPGDDVYAHLTRAELLVVAPCTANTLAKLAHGLADNLPTEAALAHRGPTLVAPAMNPRMWAHPATRANVELLRVRGVELVGPDEGETAEGEWGVGRMAEPEEIAADVAFDLAFLAAAVADYRPAEVVAGKRAKSAESWTLELEPTVDIARMLGERKRPGQVLVAFGAEHGEAGLERKRTMLAEKNVDLVVYNDVSRTDIGFDAAENEGVLVSRAGERRVPKASKQLVAAAILDAAEELL